MYARMRTCLATIRSFLVSTGLQWSDLPALSTALPTSFYERGISSAREIYVNRPRTMAELKDGGEFRSRLDNIEHR